MKSKQTIPLIIYLFSLSGCSSIKYPNWDTVAVKNTVEGESCQTTGRMETCNYSGYECPDWFRKRATLYYSNTVVYHSDLSGTKYIGKYFQCNPGLPAYKGITLDPNSFFFQKGQNTVTGQAFLRQNGGGVVTCAGATVLLYPIISESDFFDALNGQQDIIKKSQCDAQGNFEFSNIPPGKWFIRTSVNWSVYGVNALPIGNKTVYLPNESAQGGDLIQEVEVKDGEKNRFIISQ